MQIPLKSLVDKLKNSVEHRTKVELIMSINPSDTNAVALTLADAKVSSAEAQLLQLVRNANKYNGKLD